MPKIGNPAPNKGRGKRKTQPKSAERQVQDRWTPSLAAMGWTPVSDYFLRNYHRLSISHTEAMVIIHLVSFKWDSAQPYPALKTIAQRMGITVPSVRSHLRNLENRKLLTRNFRTGSTTRFDLRPLFDALEKLLAQDVQKSNDADEDFDFDEDEFEDD